MEYEKYSIKECYVELQKFLNNNELKAYWKSCCEYNKVLRNKSAKRRAQKKKIHDVYQIQCTDFAFKKIISSLSFKAADFICSESAKEDVNVPFVELRKSRELAVLHEEKDKFLRSFNENSTSRRRSGKTQGYKQKSSL